ncbi:MAG TPA: hypothetical protein VFE29_09265 [Terriglobia bacterium]|nr:hypothetical protein [Terriglobia bacterium]
MFCMAIWLSGTVFMIVVATQNFYTIDRLLEQSPNDVFRVSAELMQNPTARDLLRYLSSELNRLYFQYWNLVQLPVGIFALRLVGPIPGSKHATWGIVAMLCVVMFLMIFITPSILSIGRSLDFVPRDPRPPSMRTFGLLHAAYSAFTFVNFVLGILVTWWIQKERPSHDS